MVLLKVSVGDSTSRAARSSRKLSLLVARNDIGMPDVGTRSFAFSLITRTSDSTKQILNAQVDKP